MISELKISLNGSRTGRRRSNKLVQNDLRGSKEGFATLAIACSLKPVDKAGDKEDGGKIAEKSGS